MNSVISVLGYLLLTLSAAVAQENSRSAAPTNAAGSSLIAAALNVPRPGPTNDGPYAPQPILQGGIVAPLYLPDSPQLNKDRIREAEVYNLSKAAPGRISSIVNIHNPSIE